MELTEVRAQTHLSFFFLINRALFFKNSFMFTKILLGKHSDFPFTTATHPTPTHSLPRYYLHLVLVWHVCYNGFANINILL